MFIDVQNLYYSAKNLFVKEVNFGNIVSEAVGGRKLIRAIAYVVRTETKEETPFLKPYIILALKPEKICKFLALA